MIIVNELLVSRRRLFLFFVAVLVFWSLAGIAPPGQISAFAQSAAATADSKKSASDLAEEWIRQVDEIEETLSSEAILPQETRAILRGRLGELTADVRGVLANDKDLIAPLRKELDSMGPLPEADAPEEPPEIAELRQALAARVSGVTARIQVGEVILARAANLETRLSLKNHNIYGRIWTRLPSLFVASTWQVAGDEFFLYFRRVAQAPTNWWSQAKDERKPGQFLPLIVVAMLAFAMAGPVRWRLRRRFVQQEKSVTAPDESQRITRAGFKGLTEMILPVAGLGLLATVISNTFFDKGLFGHILFSLCTVAIIYSVIAGLARVALAPDNPAWRLLPTTELGSRVLYRRIKISALFLAVCLFLNFTVNYFGRPSPEFVAAFIVVVDIGLVGLLATLLPQRFWETSTSERASALFAVLRTMAAVLLGAVLLVDFADYGALSTYFLLRILATAFAFAIAVLSRHAFADFLTQVFEADGRYFHHIRSWMRLSEGLVRLAKFWCGLLFDIFLFAGIAYGLLIYYGFPLDFLNLWLGRVVTGVSIGSVTLSLADFVIAIAVFIAGLIITGAMRRHLARFLQKRTQMDPGIRESIVSGVGYIGVLISVLIAIAAFGLDLSGLALVASALSVGIGFGLRTIVENFVAGLLLLIERPIKTGDWVVAGGQQGLVRRISVRSTEIETFDRASVMVPNADLISQPVQNWTHKSRLARVVVPVRVSYAADIDRVETELLACAQAHSSVLAEPAPFVIFLEFGEYSLDFKLYCYVNDAFDRLFVKSKLNFAINTAFRKAGIEIALPRTDIRIRSSDSDLLPPEAEGQSSDSG